MMKQPFQRSSGFSIIELLVAIIIIGLLIAVIVPILSMRTKEAKKKAAMSDMQHIADAQERAAIDTGYFYRLFVLDDEWAGDDIGFGYSADVLDGLMDEALTHPIKHLNPRWIFIDIKTGQLLTDDTYYNNKIRDSNETAFNWHGRYITWQRDTNPPDVIVDVIGDDIGDDPWGNNYLFFTKAGVVLEPDGVIERLYEATDGNDYDAQVFDRPTILSLGPDGLPGSGRDPVSGQLTNFGTGDDLKRQF